MSFDTIVVGGGTAGCVLASRLTEDPRRPVLLVEAGPDYTDVALLPPEIRSCNGPTYSHDWDYMATAGGTSSRSIRTPRARLVGGCSATNAGFALRGAPADYDAWARLGNEGWSFADVLPFFRRLENDLDFDGEAHGRGGPIQIRRATSDELTATHRAFLDAAVIQGIPRRADLNESFDGAGPTPMNIVGGVRQSTAMTYLARARSRPNLTIRDRCVVDRVLFEGRRAIGIVLDDGTIINGGDVILAAGAYATPAILCRSGVGPERELDSLGIPVSSDLPGVGRNLADHPLVSVRFASPMPPTDEPLFQTCAALGPPGQPDLLLAPRSVTRTTDSPTGAHGTLIVGLMLPRSRGTVTLRSRDPRDPPRIDLGYFSSPGDLTRLSEGVRLARRLIRTAPFAELMTRELGPDPECSDDEPALAAAISSTATTFHHPVGTCRMGPAGDAQAVVDSKGSVYGLDHLRIIDASIMPEIPSANTNLATIMLAEKLAVAFTAA